MSLRGKVALVTGGGSSRGADSARRLAREGAELALHYDSMASKDQTFRFRDELQRMHAGTKISVHEVELRSAAAVEQLFRNVVAEHRNLDIVVNAAGTILSDKRMFTYSVFVDGQSKQWTNRFAAEARKDTGREVSSHDRYYA